MASDRISRSTMEPMDISRGFRDESEQSQGLPYHDATQALDAAMAELSDTVEVLVKRLEPALGPDLPSPMVAESKDDRTPSSPMTDWMRAQTEGTQRLVRRLQYVMRRLEL